MKNVSKPVNINGYANYSDIANEFAAHFSNVFCNSYDEYLCKRNECIVNRLVEYL